MRRSKKSITKSSPPRWDYFWISSLNYLKLLMVSSSVLVSFYYL